MYIIKVMHLSVVRLRYIPFLLCYQSHSQRGTLLSPITVCLNTNPDKIVNHVCLVRVVCVCVWLVCFLVGIEWLACVEG